jgi:hypothetical protein
MVCGTASCATPTGAIREQEQPREVGCCSAIVMISLYSREHEWNSPGGRYCGPAATCFGTQLTLQPEHLVYARQNPSQQGECWHHRKGGSGRVFCKYARASGKIISGAADTRNSLELLFFQGHFCFWRVNHNKSCQTRRNRHAEDDVISVFHRHPWCCALTRSLANQRWRTATKD